MTAPPYKRNDNREANQIRPISIEEGFLHRADGSSRLTLGNTMVIASVFGPGQSRVTRIGERADLLAVEVILGTHCGIDSDKISSCKDIVYDVLVSCIRLDQYPQCSIVVTLRCLRDDGGLPAALVNVAIASLMHAGVEMNYFPVASSFSWRNDPKFGDLLLVDPDRKEEHDSALITIVCTADSGSNILTIDSCGVLDESTIPRCCDAAVSVAKSFAAIVRLKVEA